MTFDLTSTKDARLITQMREMQSYALTNAFIGIVNASFSASLCILAVTNPYALLSNGIAVYLFFVGSSTCIYLVHKAAVEWRFFLQLHNHIERIKASSDQGGDHV